MRTVSQEKKKTQNNTKKKNPTQKTKPKTTRGKRPGRERDVLVSRQKQTERRGSLGRGRAADKQDGIKFQVSLGQTSLRAWRRMGRTLVPAWLPPALEAAAGRMGSCGSGRTGSIPYPGAKAPLSHPSPPQHLRPSRRESPCDAEPRASLPVRGRERRGGFGACEEAGSEMLCPGRGWRHHRGGMEESS